MSLDFTTLDLLRQNHPAWRLLRSDHAPLIVAFLHRVFIEPNRRVIAQADLAEALEDELYELRERQSGQAFPKSALDYLNDWSSGDKGWLRKFYRAGSDEPQFDLAPATEKAIAWLVSLAERSFVGTESRLLTLFELLRQLSEGTEADPQRRIEELRRRREAIDQEIARIEDGDLTLLDDTAVRDRFQQFMQVARELLGDFREVEDNFRKLDRRVRERIALWQGGKGALLEEIMGERDAIADSDQGRSFRAFWDFLMSSRRQEELGDLLDRVLDLPAVAELLPDARLRRIHYDWLEAGEHTQRTVAELSRQLRRFLDDQAWLENRRIMDILHGIEARALAVRETPPNGVVMQIGEPSMEVRLPFERPLFTPGYTARLAGVEIRAGDETIDSAALFAQIVVDRARLIEHVRRSLRGQTQVSLRFLVETQPLQQGLAELVTYLHLADAGFRSHVDEGCEDEITWQAVDPAGESCTRTARMPRVLFLR